MNCGKTGGVISVDFRGFTGSQDVLQHHACYVKPGEAKSFYLVAETMNNFSNNTLYTGLSMNEPRLFEFDVIRHEKRVESMKEMNCV